MRMDNPEQIAVNICAALQDTNYNPENIVSIKIDPDTFCVTLHIRTELFERIAPAYTVIPEDWPRQELVCNQIVTENGHTIFCLKPAKFSYTRKDLHALWVLALDLAWSLSL